MILIFAGHYPESPGVCHPHDNPNWCEHSIATDWVNRIAVRARQQMNIAVGPIGPLGYKVSWVNAQCKRSQVKLAVEIHFNGGGEGRAKGSETLYCPGSIRGMMLATIVQGAVGSVMKPNRGILEGWYKQVRPPNPRAVENYFLKMTHCPALIIEPEFIYNREAIESNRDAVCDIIADSLVEAARHA